ncbi:MAG: hypothetical protein ACIARR_01195 [Phycisphaerales bacterium JB059]
MLLIDAYNVLHAQWALPPEGRGMDVPALVGLVGRSRYADRRLRVVCDGRPGPQWPQSSLLETHSGLIWARVGRAEVVFAGPDLEAEDVIEDVLDRAKGLSVLLVSSDRRLVRAAGQAGADQVGNGTFLRQLWADLNARPGGDRPAFVSEVPLDRYSVAHWMREFGYDPGATQDPAPSQPPAPPAPTPAPPSPTPPNRSPSRRGRGVTSGPPPEGAPFGEGLNLPTPSGPPSPAVPPTPPARSESTAPARPPEAPRSGPEHEPLDPLLQEAFEEWRGRLSLDDLDMSRWIDDVQEIKRPGGRRREGPGGGASRRP